MNFTEQDVIIIAVDKRIKGEIDDYLQDCGAERIDLRSGIVKYEDIYNRIRPLADNFPANIMGINEPLNKKYVKEGVARFTTQKYSSYYGRNIMLGFIVKKIDVSANVRLIEKIQNAELDQHMHGGFQLIKRDNMTESYKCIYQIKAGEVELRHIFSDYSSIIQ